MATNVAEQRDRAERLQGLADDAERQRRGELACRHVLGPLDVGEQQVAERRRGGFEREAVDQHAGISTASGHPSPPVGPF